MPLKKHPVHTQTRIPHSSAYSKAEMKVLKALCGSPASLKGIAWRIWDTVDAWPAAGAIIGRLKKQDLVIDREPSPDQPKRWHLTDLGRKVANTIEG